jgi:hypothetical protein
MLDKLAIAESECFKLFLLFFLLSMKGDLPSFAIFFVLENIFCCECMLRSHECKLSGKGAGIKVLAVWPNSRIHIGNTEKFDKSEFSEFTIMEK